MHAESAHEMPGCESSCYKVCESGDKGGRARILGADMRGYEGDFSETAGKQLRQQGDRWRFDRRQRGAAICAKLAGLAFGISA
ncbi:MAG: hypothetical protein FHK82_16080 [Sedimenticola thiotaurini]|uniref:Uncharacterized protein n=1 Tax=Sedimenticola thiotaurini TaxID=1543721 RepID=A0A558CRE2_9GAMM|nr:MAG: hypothetical protein FHK82_16080 [Sedimenticola thiotaurini]